MDITFTLNLDGDVDDFASLMTWLSDHYHHVEIHISVPEFAAHAVASETGPRLVSVNHPSTVVQTIIDHEDSVREAKAAARAANTYTQYCMCSHDQYSHSTEGDRPCLADACSCPSWTAVSPFPPVTLDEM